jgi:hypothetical protein
MQPSRRRSGWDDSAMDRLSAHEDVGPLSAAEIDAVRGAVAATVEPRPGGGEWSFATLFLAWRRMVAEVEVGYSWCPSELSNDLFCRGALARVWPLLPDRLAGLWQMELDELDARFRAATIAWPGHAEDEQEWWRRRVPRRLEAEPDDPLIRGWPMDWSTLPFPRPGERGLTRRQVVGAEISPASGSPCGGLPGRPTHGARALSRHPDRLRTTGRSRA